MTAACTHPSFLYNTLKLSTVALSRGNLQSAGMYLRQAEVELQSYGPDGAVGPMGLYEDGLDQQRQTVLDRHAA